MGQTRTASDILRLIESFSDDQQIVFHEAIPSREARFAEPAVPVAEPIAACLQQQGIESLYSHQAQALDLIRRGENAVIVTGTASGKSLCYNIPILEAVQANPRFRALYLFPTKALAQDQLKVLKRFLPQGEDPLPVSGSRGKKRPDPPTQPTDGALQFRAGTYDGDTSPSLRNRLRDEANLLLTNPDMLHAGILPNHARWAEFFTRLEYIVVDEIHIYRGIFGSHVANVLRRLRRICRHYGADPTWVCASATIANPAELASKLTGVDFRIVDDDGSPRGRKHFVFWNPPTYGEGGMERRSSTLEARDLFLRLVRDGYQTIVFVKARLLTEVLLRYCQEELREDGGGLAKRIRAYRAGYLPEERRKIEAALFGGELLGVISTNALELGIDVGSLDAAILVGYPGTIASTWQQAGRAGRRQKESVAILIGHNAPIDQYLMQNPGYFFGNSPETAILDPANPHILLNHLRCATYEIPVRVEDEGSYGEYAPAILDLLQDKRIVRQVKGRWFYTQEDYPASTFSLRNSGDNVYTIVDTTEKNRVVGTIDEPSAFSQVHPQAIYMQEGETYFVDELDLSERVVYIHRADLDYYTQAVSDTQIEAHEPDLEQKWRKTETFFGECSIHEKMTMFKKIKFGSRDSLGYGNIDLPHTSLHTTALWLVPPAEAIGKVMEWGRVPADGLTGIANVLAEVISLHAMCDPHDLGTAVDMRNTGGPTLFLYDKYPGGLGYAQRAYHIMEEVMNAALRLIEKCPCRDGCPSCVGSPLPPHFSNDPDSFTKGRIPDKEAALCLLHAMLEMEEYVPRVPLEGIRALRAEKLLSGSVADEDAALSGEPGAPRGRSGRKRSGSRRSGAADRASDSASEQAAVDREVRPLPEDLRRKLEGQITRLEELRDEPRRRRSIRS